MCLKKTHHKSAKVLTIKSANRIWDVAKQLEDTHYPQYQVLNDVVADLEIAIASMKSQGCI